jgi:hypothetical protein
MFLVHKVFLATAYPQGELVETMNRFFACLALCASLSASAQDGCELFNFQELATENQELATENQELATENQQLSDSIAALNTELDNCGANLEGANLDNAFIYQANLTGADLSGANLSSAYMIYANLTGADLSGADLSGAAMTCLQGCPSLLPSGYTCEPDPGCWDPTLKRIVSE